MATPLYQRFDLTPCDAFDVGGVFFSLFNAAGDEAGELRVTSDSTGHVSLSVLQGYSAVDTIARYPLHSKEQGLTVCERFLALWGFVADDELFI